MARLDLEAAPPTALPAAGLTLAAAWTVAAGLLLCVDGSLATASRWTPSTLALVHALTLGVFANAATGALLQFLPAAAGVRVPGGVHGGVAVLLLLDAGTLVLVGGFRTLSPAALTAGGVMVAAAVAVLAVLALPALARHRPLAHLHIGLGAAIVVLACTAALGLAMVLGLTGHGGIAPLRWIDVHASWGLGGAVTLLLAAIAQQVVPMFHGAQAMAPRRFAAWLVALVGALLAVAATRAAPPALAALGGCVAGWAVSTLWRQVRTRRQHRNPVLVNAWRGACVATVAAVAAGLASGARLAGAIALGLALPLFVVPMLLEITAFLGWLGLYRAVRGRVPGVHALQPERDKAIVVAMQAAAGLALVAAVQVPAEATARLAGLAFVLAGALLLAALVRLRLRCRSALRDASGAGPGRDRAPSRDVPVASPPPGPP